MGWPLAAGEAPLGAAGGGVPWQQVLARLGACGMSTLSFPLKNPVSGATVCCPAKQSVPCCTICVEVLLNAIRRTLVRVCTHGMTVWHLRYCTPSGFLEFVKTHAVYHLSTASMRTSIRIICPSRRCQDTSCRHAVYNTAGNVRHTQIPRARIDRRQLGNLLGIDRGLQVAFPTCIPEKNCMLCKNHLCARLTGSGPQGGAGQGQGGGLRGWGGFVPKALSCHDTDSTGMTGKSSGRGTWDTPKQCQMTGSDPGPTSRSCTAQPPRIVRPAPRRLTIHQRPRGPQMLLEMQQFCACSGSEPPDCIFFSCKGSLWSTASNSIAGAARSQWRCAVLAAAPALPPILTTVGRHWTMSPDTTLCCEVARRVRVPARITCCAHCARPCPPSDITVCSPDGKRSAWTHSSVHRSDQNTFVQAPQISNNCCCCC